MCKEKKDKNWFYIDNRRAMVSLGPVSNKKTCPYSCAFCYVQDGFCSYEQKDIDDIISFLVRYRENYDIIYVSGDTDSFATPRKEQGILLLQQIAQNINCDLLFTTRTTFNDYELSKLGTIVEILRRKGKRLYACISITRYSEELSYLEPKPIPSPKERIEMLNKLHCIGAVTVLAMRPFLPVVPINDYLKVLELVRGFIDIVLGEIFYFTLEGNIQHRVFPEGVPPEIESELLRNQRMDFDKNMEEWQVWPATSIEKIVRNYCENNNIIFSMRSQDAIEKYENTRNV